MGWIDLAWLVPVLPLAAAFLIGAVGKRLPWRGAEIGIGAVAAALVIAAGIAWHAYTNAPMEPVERVVRWAPLGDGFHLEIGTLVDGLTAVMFLLVTVVSLLVQIYSREYMHGEPRFTYFFAMLSLFTGSMLLLVVSNNLLMTLVGWELVGVCSYLLISFYWEEKSNQDAGNKAFLTTKFADVGFVVGIIVLWEAMSRAGEGTFNILRINGAAASGQLDQGLVIFGLLMLFLGAVGKSGQMPLHVWLPDAMAGPTPVSALIHAATMVTAGVFIVARMYPAYAQSAAVLDTIAIVGTVTLFAAGLLALVQDDIKKVLAYSTISQLGYMVAALGVGGYTAAVFHLFTHGFFKALLFLGSGSMIHAVHSNDLSRMGGLRRYMPHTFWTFIVGSLALAGFPLTAGFFSKDEILVSARAWGEVGGATGPLVFWVGLLAAGITTFYMARACLLAFWGEYRGEGHPHESGRWMTVPLVILAIGSLTVGWIGSPWWSEARNFERWTATPLLEETRFPFATAEAGHALGPLTTDAPVAAAAAGAEHEVGAVLHGPPSFHPDVAGLALLVFLIGLGAAWRAYYGRRPEEDPMLQLGWFSRALINRYWIDDLGYRYIVVPVRDRLSRAAYWTNQHLIDAVVNAAGVSARRLGDATYHVVDQGVIDGAVNGSAFSAAWWSARLKRIQSGNVQRYAGALVAGVILLVLVLAVG